MVYENCLIYGPYKRKDCRYIVIIKWPNGHFQTVSYPKYCMEKLLNKYLLESEEVHHIDENLDNNDISNFEVKDKTEHIRDHRLKYIDDKEVSCFWCNKKFVLTPKQQSYRTRNQNKDRAGPFCSKRCCGLFGRNQQN